MTTQSTISIHRHPAWVDNFTRMYAEGVSHAFILHFNTQDYVLPGMRLRTFLAQMLNQREIVAFYNRSEGIYFPLESHRERFIRILGLDSQERRQEAVMAGVLEERGPARHDPKVALMLLTRLLRMGEPGTKFCSVVVEYAETLLPIQDSNPVDRDIQVMVLEWARDSRIQNNGSPVFLVTENLSEIHPSLRSASSRYESIEVPLPDTDRREAFIEWWLDQPFDDFEGGRKKSDIIELEASTTTIANITAGLNLIHLEDIFLRATREHALTLEMVKERKARIMRSEYNDVLAAWDPKFTFADIGGLEHVKAFFRKNVITPIQNQNYSRVPMGVLMTGPAGTGKSIVADAVAHECGINAFELNLAKVYDGLVGSSERNLERVLRAIEGMAPTLVFLDEIDQKLQRGETGDSGVSQRLFGRILEFMADTSHRGKIIFLAATNRPDLMDAAMKRSGRFDKKVPFLVPDEGERYAIFQVMAERYLQTGIKVSTETLARTEGWTGAEIEGAAVKALEIWQDDNCTANEAMDRAVSRIIPTTSDVEYMTAIALAECNDLDMLPEKYRQERLDPDFDRKVTELRPEGPIERHGRTF